MYTITLRTSFAPMCSDGGSSNHTQSALFVYVHRTIILPVVLYGCETWSLILREKRRLRVFENRVLRRIFEPKSV
jgi:hypothetical protein